MKKWLTATVAMLLSSASFAIVPPAPFWHDVVLSDGSVTKVRLTGSADFHWYEDEQGNALIEQQERWFFAEIKNDGIEPYLMSSGEEKFANSFAPSVAQDRSALLVPQSRAKFGSLPVIERTRSMPRSNYASRAAFTSQATPFKQPLLVVQVSFSDIQMEHDFTDLVFSQVNQSVVDYYDKNSFGQYRVVPAEETSGTVNDGVIDVAVLQPHPNCHNGSLCTSRLNAVFSEAYREVNKFVDFAPYDLNGNGTIDPTELSVMFVFAGGDRSTGVLNKPAIWPHMFSHDTMVVDGKGISAYCLFADFQVNNQSTLGVIVHELGHLMLGLPDLYSYEHKGSVGSWGVMGGGSWTKKEGDLHAGDTPVNMSAWSRHAAGFIDPKILKSSDSQVVVANQQAAIVNLDPYLQQFGPRLYVENRRKVDYDRALEAEGVLVTSVNINNAFNDRGPMQVQIMQADGLSELETGGWTDFGDLYPGLSQNSQISDTSSPSLTSVTGFETNIRLDDIVSSPDSASFLLSLPVEGGESAWLTSLRRSYVFSESDKDSAAFSLVLASDSLLEGVQLYYQKLNVLQPVDYVIASYPASNANFAALKLNPSERKVLAQGSIHRIGNERILFDTPAKMDAGAYTLVVELKNAQLEQNYLFSELRNMEPQERDTTWLGNAQTSNSDGMAKLPPHLVIPFAALLDQDFSGLLLPIDDILEVNKNGQLQLPLISNDVIDAALLGNLSIDIVSAPKYGTLDGLLYTAKPHFVGADPFTYQLRTLDGRTVSKVGNVTVNVVGPNAAPQVQVSVQATSLLPGDAVVLDGSATQDPDGDPLVYQWRKTFGPAISLQRSDTVSLRFTLPESVKMGDALMFALQANDPSGLSHMSHVRLVVENSPPIARDDFLSVKAGTSIDATPLANDSDHDGQVLQISSLSQPSIGSAELFDNQIRYQAPSRVERETEVVINYVITDTEGKTAQAQLVVTVTPVPSAASSSSSGSGSSGGGVNVWALVLMTWLFGCRRRKSKA
ncbi:M6 family metalloprotease domain-containing protein [Vibrio sp. 05-20-BW147]|uniref:M6 family metalloprotease domain-containing protein n=1 Tax=Vibrio sp. 05-20-BW147 TaxID=2575834 RepID=UPI001592C517|nr:M6 family metalloprotease domain-containing protein [Vibrio sp. 05-20-BW147]NVC62185.1 M6 family metalloprotease domain-containing protein [Vibrio sp. 05-20-BW147]